MSRPAASRRIDPRVLGGLALAGGVAYLGGLILGEYPFNGLLPVVGGLLLGAAVGGAVALVLRAEPPAWAVVVAAILAVWGELIAVRREPAEIPQWPWPWQAFGGGHTWRWPQWAALAAAAIGGLYRLTYRLRSPETSGGDGPDDGT